MKKISEIFKLIFSFILFLILFYLMYQLDNDVTISMYGVVLAIYLFSKMLFSTIYKKANKPVKKDYKVTCVVPCYNEASDALIETLDSLVAQTYPIHEIYFIDDHSSDDSGYQGLVTHIIQNKEKYKNVNLYQLPTNKGKRHAQSYAFERSNADVFFTVDSDTYVYPNALEELLKAFNDSKVYAVTGHINARNRDENLLTRLIDIRYENAFRFERAAQSTTGNILTCSGPLSCYRREVIIPNLNKYKNQKFLGVPVNIGDDRCLTNYANKLGKTKYQSSARCVTDVPNNLKQFLKQQIRWNKSFFRESIISIKLLFKRPIVSFWALLEIVLFLMLSISMVSLVLRLGGNFGYKTLIAVMIGVCISSLARNVHYAMKHPLLFLLSPLYAILHLLLLQPIRLYALLTIRNAKWGTRDRITEINLLKKESI